MKFFGMRSDSYRTRIRIRNRFHCKIVWIRNTGLLCRTVTTVIFSVFNRNVASHWYPLPVAPPFYQRYRIDQTTGPAYSAFLRHCMTPRLLYIIFFWGGNKLLLTEQLSKL